MTDHYAHVTKEVLRRGLFLNGGGDTVVDRRQGLTEMQTMTTESLIDLLIASLPPHVLCEGQIVQNVCETADLVIAETQVCVRFSLPS